jgi:hypothetical protein
MNMDWKSSSQDWSDANVANTWSSLDLYQLLTYNQLLIESNPNKYQYKSNWCLIRVVSIREFYLAETLSYNWEIGINWEENRVFWAKEFLVQGYKGKMGIKNTEMIIINLGIFSKFFMIFGWRELLK